MKIPIELIPEAYQLSKRVYADEINIKEARDILVDNNRINQNSANDYIRNFKHLMNGDVFHRTLNTESMDYYLEHIYSDYGVVHGRNALSALEKHIEYYEGIHKGNTIMHSMRDIHEKYSRIIGKISIDGKEQAELTENIVKNRPRAEIISDLKSLKETDSEAVIIAHKVYKRDNLTIAEIKSVRGYNCQICGISITIKDGGKYIEAAHIIAKRDKGREVPGNILILCPNHHKEFDLGERLIISHNEKEVKFLLNGSNYQISLILE